MLLFSVLNFFLQYFHYRYVQVRVSRGRQWDHAGTRVAALHEPLDLGGRKPARQLQSLSVSHPKASCLPSPALSHMRQDYFWGTAIILLLNYPQGSPFCLLFSEIYLVPSSYMEILVCNSQGQGGWASHWMEVLCVWAATLHRDSRFQQSEWYGLFRIVSTMAYTNQQNSLANSLSLFAFKVRSRVHIQQRNFTGTVFFIHLNHLKTQLEVCKTSAGSRTVYSAIQISSASPLDMTIYQ